MTNCLEPQKKTFCKGSYTFRQFLVLSRTQILLSRLYSGSHNWDERQVLENILMAYKYVDVNMAWDLTSFCFLDLKLYGCGAIKSFFFLQQQVCTMAHPHLCFPPPLFLLAFDIPILAPLWFLSQTFHGCWLAWAEFCYLMVWQSRHFYVSGDR